MQVALSSPLTSYFSVGICFIAILNYYSSRRRSCFIAGSIGLTPH